MSFKTCSVTSVWTCTDWIQDKLRDDVIPDSTWDHPCVYFAGWGSCVSLLKPVTFPCHHWDQCITLGGCVVCYCPALLCLPLTFRFKAECLSIHTPLHHWNSPHQHSPSGAGLDCQHRRQRVGRPLILLISGARLKGPEAKTRGLKTTGFLIQLCLRWAGLSAVHVPPTAETSGCCLLREEWARMTEHSFIALK